MEEIRELETLDESMTQAVADDSPYHYASLDEFDFVKQVITIDFELVEKNTIVKITAEQAGSIVAGDWYDQETKEFIAAADAPGTAGSTLDIYLYGDTHMRLRQYLSDKETELRNHNHDGLYAPVSAQNAAANALNAANRAETKADEALAAANSVDGKATEALTAANSANTKAGEASAAADSAGAKAEEALTAANNADAKAGEALTAANNADAKAVKALSDALAADHNHANKDVLDTITSLKTSSWDSTASHVADGVKHITAQERTNWNAKAAGDHTHTASQVGAATANTFTATLTAAGWSASAPYQQVLSLSGVLGTDMPEVGPVFSSVLSTRKAQREAWNLVGDVESGANTLTFLCDEEKPKTDVPIQILCVR